MKNGIFGKWFREFATIVFTQTVQAFLLAIVMSIIVSSLADSGADGVSAAGLLAVVALSSFGKVEMLVKNIFGVTSGFGDPGSLRAGRGITTGGMLAYRGYEKIKNNIGDIREGKRMINKANAGLTGLKASGGGDLNADKTVAGLSSENGTDNEGLEGAAADVGKELTEQTLKLQTMGDIAALTDAIKRLTTATETSNKTDTQSKMEKYQQMLEDGRKQMKSGVFETVGATIGAAGGAIGGLAEGEGIAEKALSGAGFGDDIGKAIAVASSNKEQYKRDMQKYAETAKKNEEESNKKVEEFKDAMSKKASAANNPDMAKAINKATEDALKAYNDNILKNINNINEQIAKSSGKVSDIKTSKKTLSDIQKRLDQNTKADS